jgi:hypothetical protein
MKLVAAVSHPELWICDFKFSDLLLDISEA